MRYTLKRFALSVSACCLALSALPAAWCADSMPLLYERPTSEPSFDVDQVELGKDGKRRYARFRDHREFPDRRSGRVPAEEIDREPAMADVPAIPDQDDVAADAAALPEPEEHAVTTPPEAPVRSTPVPAAPVAAVASAGACGWCESAHPPEEECYEIEYYEEPPTPEGVENYRAKLAARLYERYNNHPNYSGKVGKVSVVMSKPLETSLDGRFILAEFDQLVYDIWGRRIPALEKEYYVVTFGSGGAAEVRTDPTVRIGLDLHGSYSELAPLAADPFARIQDPMAPPPAVTPAMPGWWRPEFPELR